MTTTIELINGNKAELSSLEETITPTAGSNVRRLTMTVLTVNGSAEYGTPELRDMFTPENFTTITVISDNQESILEGFNTVDLISKSFSGSGSKTTVILSERNDTNKIIDSK